MPRRRVFRAFGRQTPLREDLSMARQSTTRRRQRESDPMDSLKPLIVLGLLGTIMYGAYSVVQKGPASAPSGVTFGDASPGPAIEPPQVSFGGGVDPAGSPSAIGAPPVGSLDAIAPHPLAGAEPLHPSGPLSAPVPAVAAAALNPAPAPFPVEPPPMTAAASLPAAPSALPPAPFETAAAPAAVDPLALAGAGAIGAAAAVAPGAAGIGATAPAADPRGAAPSSAFAAAWADAHEKLTAGRYAEALSVLSVWYDDPTLGLEESQRLEDLLGQLAGTVIYSQQDLLLPPHVVAPGDTLPSIAGPLQVPWQLLAKINGVSDPSQLVPGEHLKVVRGPFDAVISLSRRRMSLQVGGNYAGSFPVVLGRQVYDRVGRSMAVVDIRRPGATPEASGFAAQVAYAPAAAKSIVLGEGLSIEGVEDPSLVADSASPASVIVSLRDLEDIADILGPGSQVLVRK